MTQVSETPLRLGGHIDQLTGLKVARNGNSYLHFRLHRDNEKAPLFCSVFGDVAESIDRQFGNGSVVRLFGRFDRQQYNGGQAEAYRFRVFSCDAGT